MDFPDSEESSSRSGKVGVRPEWKDPYTAIGRGDLHDLAAGVRPGKGLLERR